MTNHTQLSTATPIPVARVSKVRRRRLSVGAITAVVVVLASGCAGDRDGQLAASESATPTSPAAPTQAPAPTAGIGRDDEPTANAQAHHFMELLTEGEATETYLLTDQSFRNATSQEAWADTVERVSGAYSTRPVFRGSEVRRDASGRDVTYVTYYAEGEGAFGPYHISLELIEENGEHLVDRFHSKDPTLAQTATQVAAPAADTPPSEAFDPFASPCGTTSTPSTLVGTGPSTLFAVDASGKLRWQTSVSEEGRLATAINGRVAYVLDAIVAGSYDGIRIFDGRTGEVRAYQPGNRFWIAYDCTIVIARTEEDTRGGELYGYSPDGTRLWEAPGFLVTQTDYNDEYSKAQVLLVQDVDSDTSAWRVLEPATGRELWSRPSGSGRPVQALGSVVISISTAEQGGQEYVEAFRVTDGDPLWAWAVDDGASVGNSVRFDVASATTLVVRDDDYPYFSFFSFVDMTSGATISRFDGSVLGSTTTNGRQTFHVLTGSSIEFVATNLRSATTVPTGGGLRDWYVDRALVTSPSGIDLVDSTGSVACSIPPTFDSYQFTPTGYAFGSSETGVSFYDPHCNLINTVVGRSLSLHSGTYRFGTTDAPSIVYSTETSVQVFDLATGTELWSAPI